MQTIDVEESLNNIYIITQKCECDLENYLKK